MHSFHIRYLLARLLLYILSKAFGFSHTYLPSCPFDSYFLFLNQGLIKDCCLKGPQQYLCQYSLVMILPCVWIVVLFPEKQQLVLLIIKECFDI